MKDVNDLMQAILEMDAAQRKVSEKAKLERTARLAALDEQKPRLPSKATPPPLLRWSSSASRPPRP